MGVFAQHGPAPKSVPRWGPDPDLTQRFLHQRAAITEDDPWTLIARPRTSEYGAHCPKVSQAIWTAIQAAITGTAALSRAQSAISSIPQGKSG